MRVMTGETPKPAWWISRDPECKTPGWGLIASVCDRRALHYEVPLFEAPTASPSEAADATRYRWLRERITWLVIDLGSSFDIRAPDRIHSITENSMLRRDVDGESVDRAIDEAMNRGAD